MEEVRVRFPMGPPKTLQRKSGCFCFIWHYGPMSIGQVRVRFPMGPPKTLQRKSGCFCFIWHYGTPSPDTGYCTVPTNLVCQDNLVTCILTTARRRFCCIADCLGKSKMLDTLSTNCRYPTSQK